MPEPDPVDQAWADVAANLDTAPQVPQYLTVKDVSRLVRVHPDTVRTWAKTGSLRGTKVPGQGLWRFARQDVLDFMALGRPAPPECQHCGCTGHLPSA